MLEIPQAKRICIRYMKKASTTFLCKDRFLSDLNQFSTAEKFWVACSGGMDSCVLLHLFYLNKSVINQDIEVLYVNHGLQEEANDWAEFCEEQCKQYGLYFRQLKINEDCPKGASIEAWAREKRYSLIEEVMNKNDVFFTAHHQDDQVETFFLQALRGAGPRGLASMPSIKKRENIFHARPLLNYSREKLKYYAEENKLIWQLDKSNSDYRYDRNYFRHKVIPVIEERWPAYRETIARLIKHQNESRVLLDDLGCSDIKLAQYKNTMALNLGVVKKLSLERQKNLIFSWLKELNLKYPGARNMEQIISDVIYSSTDKAPCVNWLDVEVRRYKNILYASNVMLQHDVSTEYQWKPDNILNVLNETLIAKSDHGKGISKLKSKGANFVVRYRQGGEKIQPDRSSHSKTVKQLFQEQAVLPWFRDRVPLIYINGELAVIPGICIDARYVAEKDEASWDICWSGYENAIDNNE
ncbi:MAG TPA: tRNA lysidine(34) synthetase TilS [Thiotrichaceae bacterium]|nr:tRNA lysidine(34) synthetase TilS [Thiotrichaceae bacterium]HIM07985.1 tRNA lysidine(34) synthetase TilS [Gammaproteobacteria bacterium]